MEQQVNDLMLLIKYAINNRIVRTGADFFSWTLNILILRSPQCPKTHLPYPAEFRQQMIELVRAGRTPAELSREFQVTAQTIQNWVGQAARDAGQPLPGKEGLSTTEREELARLRRQVKQLQTERDILAKATAWFAGRSGVTPTSSSNS